jgi:hypothetical protein
MANLEEPFRQRGSGYLVLKSGARSQVEWEIYYPPSGTPS